MSRRKRARNRRFPSLAAFVVLLLLLVVGLAGYYVSQNVAVVVKTPQGPQEQPTSRLQPPATSSVVSAPSPAPDQQPTPPVKTPAVDPAQPAEQAGDDLTKSTGQPKANIQSDANGSDVFDKMKKSTDAGAGGPTSAVRPDKPTDDPNVRTWSDARGRFTVDAKLVKQNRRSVTLKRLDNGKQVTILISRLSRSDQRFLKNLAAKPTEQAKLETPINPTAQVIVGRVIRVSDGDTIDIADSNGPQQRIRFNGIDAPEYTQRHGPEVRRWLAKQIAGKTVRAELVEKDRYDRWTANLYLGDVWLNLELVQRGLAWHYHHYSDDRRLAEAHRQARTNRIGIWRDENPLPPWKYREQNREDKNR